MNFLGGYQLKKHPVLHDSIIHGFSELPAQIQVDEQYGTYWDNIVNLIHSTLCSFHLKLVELPICGKEYDHFKAERAIR